MKHYNVTLEIEIDSDSPLNAAKKVQNWIRDQETDWYFYVQDKNNVYSVDLDNDEVQIEDNYIPLIN